MPGLQEAADTLGRALEPTQLKRFCNPYTILPDMTTPEFERTQVWANNLTSASASPLPPVAAAPAAVKPLLSKKPELKALTKEEKLILASGGALAIGLGAIVMVSLPDTAQAQPLTPPAETTDLVAPELDLSTQPVLTEPLETATPPPPPRHRPAAPREPAAAHPSPPPTAPAPVEAEEHHALLQIPETPEVATSVGDDLTFLEAFHAARAEVGPAGLFAWRNTFYSTFTDKEWELVPEDQKEKWLEAAEPIIDPGYENLSEVPANAEPMEATQHVIVAERGALTWTGIDRDGDGQVEVLMGRINGQSPMVLMDTDGDGVLDTRYDFDAQKGKAYASQIEPFSMSSSEIEHMEYVSIEGDMGFFNEAERMKSTGTLPVSIFEEDGRYVITMDSNNDKTIDAITYLTDDKGPVVGLDFDNDGKIEMGYLYDPVTQSVSATEVLPLEEMTVDDPEFPAYASLQDHEQIDGYLLESQTTELTLADDLPDAEDTDPTDDTSYRDSEDILYS